MAKIEFGKFEVPEKVNPYTEAVKALNESEDPTAALIITVDAKDALTEQLKVQKAANAIGKTARLREKDDSGVRQGANDDEGNPTLEGEIRLKFTLVKMHKGRRTGKKNDSSNEADVTESAVA